MEPGGDGIASIRIGSVCQIGGHPIELTDVTIDDVEGDIALSDFSVYPDPDDGTLGSGAEPLPISKVSAYKGSPVISAPCPRTGDVSGESLAVELTLSSGSVGTARGFTLSWGGEGGTYTSKIPWTQTLCRKMSDCS
jgi:hypothetical protein